MSEEATKEAKKEELTAQDTMRIVSSLLTDFCSSYAVFLIGKKISRVEMSEIISKTPEAERLIKERPRGLFEKLAPMFVKIANSEDLGELDIDIALKEFREEYDAEIDLVLEMARTEK